MSVKNDPLAFLPGGWQMGRQIQAFDWSKTSLDPITQWPPNVTIHRETMTTPEPAPTTADGKQDVEKTSLRILIVDDNRDGADTLQMMLRLMGNEVCTAYDGLEGIKVAEECRPDVILLDIGLPSVDGYEVCRCIREQPWGKKTVLIAATGWGLEDDRRRSHEAGFDHHLVKPVDSKALACLLADVVAKKASST